MSDNFSYTMEYMIENAYTDMYGRVKLSKILAVVQQASEQHCLREGLGYKKLAESGYAFLLVRLKLKIHSLPTMGERIQLTTAVYMPERTVYRRTTDIRTLSGEIMAELDARWALVDVNTHTICRTVPEIVMGYLKRSDGQVPDFRPPKLAAPSILYVFDVRPHMLDMNRHLTNSIYGDIVYDCINMVVQDKDISEITIFYHREARCGDSITVLYELNESYLAIKGKLHDEDCFSSCVYFA